MMAKTIYCNICGKKFDKGDINADVSFTAYCGYESEYDGQTAEFDICCKCFDEMIKKCIISPLK